MVISKKIENKIWGITAQKKNIPLTFFFCENHTTMVNYKIFYFLKSPIYGWQIISLISQFVGFLSNAHYNGNKKNEKQKSKTQYYGDLTKNKLKSPNYGCKKNHE